MEEKRIESLPSVRVSANENQIVRAATKKAGVDIGPKMRELIMAWARKIIK
jgi:hypothetical protein